jgi:peptide deformylase
MNTIITHNDPERFPILEVQSQECSVPLSETDLSYIEHMDAILTQLGDEAAGLAAVQIGYPKRIFLLRNNNENKAYINPVVIAHSKEKRRRPEACLSLPGMVVRTERPKSITLQYLDLNGQQHTEHFEGFYSQCVAHEMDHLNGILLVKHLQEQYDNQSRRTSFGMKLTPQKRKAIAKRRAKKR